MPDEKWRYSLIHILPCLLALSCMHYVNQDEPLSTVIQEEQPEHVRLRLYGDSLVTLHRPFIEKHYVVGNTSEDENLSKEARIPLAEVQEYEVLQPFVIMPLVFAGAVYAVVYLVYRSTT